MPILITPPAPLASLSQLPVARIYAIIDRVSYERRGRFPKVIVATVGYYASESACNTAEQVSVPGLVGEIRQPVTPEQANGLPIFDVLDGLLRAELQAVMPEGTVLEMVA
jgi:hypothetical protein